MSNENKKKHNYAVKCASKKNKRQESNWKMFDFR